MSATTCCLSREQLLVLRLLTRRKGITSLEAAKFYDIVSIHPRFTELERLGVGIKREPLGDTNAKRYFATKVPKWLLDQIEKKEVSHA